MKTPSLLIPLACLSLLAACTVAPGGGGGSSSSESSVSSAQSSAQASSFAGWQSFSDPEQNYSLQYPPTFRLETQKQTIITQLTGAVLHYPSDFQTGTAYFEGTIELTSEQQTCKPVTSVMLSGTPAKKTIAGTMYVTQSGADVGAGNLYQTYDYTTIQNGMCHHFTLTIHSCNLGPDCGTGHTQPLQKEPILNMFEQILSTVQFAPTPTASPAGSAASEMTTSMSAKAGTPFTITLDSNPTTGFSWTPSYDKTMFALDSSTYIAPNSSALGAGGQAQFTFHALKSGTADITFAYSRSWETNVPPAQVRVYTVTVK
ncbi:MAG TPA: protease inhibitor I42 family protein [Candidatus Peribacteraceae bacterium]|nr:protease inhibitor I42 family protein [Candidatus Peribacteraceae bacterium]